MKKKLRPQTQLERAISAAHNFNKQEVQLKPCQLCGADVPTRGVGVSLQHQMGPSHRASCPMYVAHESTCSCEGCKQARVVTSGN